MDEKTCTKCKAVKPLNEFYKHRNRPDGHDEQCKACRWEYEHTPERIAYRAQWRKTPAGIAAKERYLTPEKSRAYTAKYRSTQNGKERTDAYYEWFKQTFPNRHRARLAVMHALEDGKIVKPNTCECCGKKHHSIHAHHDSYEQEHWLDVRWLCAKCHKILHSKLTQSN